MSTKSTGGEGRLPGIYPLENGFIVMLNAGPWRLWIGVGRRGAVRLINWLVRDDVEYGLMELLYA